MKVLNVSRYHPHQELRHQVNLVTGKEWNDAMDGFSSEVKGEAANLAAHGWDVVFFGPEHFLKPTIFIGGCERGYFYTQDGQRTLMDETHRDHFYPRSEPWANNRRCWDEERTEGKGAVWRDPNIHLSHFGKEGCAFMIANQALLLYSEVINSESTCFLRVSGEEWEPTRDKENRKRKLQSFWDTLRKTI